MDNEDTTTMELEMGTPKSSPVPGAKKRGRRSKKTVQSEEGVDEEVQREIKMKKPALKRGRPKKAKAVKKEPSSPVGPMDDDTEGPSSPSLSTLLEQSKTSDQQDNQPQVKVKRRRGGGCRRANKKNAAGGENLRSVHLMDKVDIEDITPDEDILLDELVGFEHVEVFNAMLGTYKLMDNIQETEMVHNIYAIPPMQYNAVNFGNKQTISLQMLPKSEPGSSHMF